MEPISKAILVGLTASFLLLSPLFFLPADSGLLVGLVLCYMSALLLTKLTWLELTPIYAVFSLVFMAGAQINLHSQLLPFQLVENISLLIGTGILLFFIIAAMMSLYALIISITKH